MANERHESGGSSPLLGALFPASSRRPPVSRSTQAALRTVHIVAMAMILGALPQHASRQALGIWILVVLASGVLLLACELWKTGRFLAGGAGAAVLLKLVCLGLGNLFPGGRFPWYLAATVVASFGAHMSSSWRHFSFLEWRVVKVKGGQP